MHTVAGCSRTVAGWSRTLQDGGTGSLAAMHRVAGLTSAWESRACSSRDGCIRFQPGQLGLQPLAHMVAGLAWNSRSCSSVANLVSSACVPATSASSFAPITRTWDTCGYRVDRQGHGRSSGSGYMALASSRPCSDLALAPVSPPDAAVAALRHQRHHRRDIERVQLVLDLGGVVVVRVHRRSGRSAVSGGWACTAVSGGWAVLQQRHNAAASRKAAGRRDEG